MYMALIALTKFQDDIEVNLYSSEDDEVEEEEGDKDLQKIYDELLLEFKKLAKSNYKLKNENKKLNEKLQNLDSPKEAMNESEPNQENNKLIQENEKLIELVKSFKKSVKRRKIFNF